MLPIISRRAMVGTCRGARRLQGSNRRGAGKCRYRGSDLVIPLEHSRPPQELFRSSSIDICLTTCVLLILVCVYAGPCCEQTNNHVYDKFENLIDRLCSNQSSASITVQQMTMDTSRSSSHTRPHIYKNPLSCSKRAIFSSSLSRGSRSKLRFQNISPTSTCSLNFASDSSMYI